VTTAGPVAALPGVPTVAEACGLPGFVSTTWYGLLGPAGMAPAIVARINDAVQQVITSAEFAQWLTNTQGIAPPPVTTPEAFGAILRRDVASWAEVVRRSGATVD
jgi:tripartite-type tricarboxylate transporter receptor subunit TctC